MELDERTQHFNCSQLNDTKYEFQRLYENTYNTSAANMTTEEYLDVLELYVQNASNMTFEEYLNNNTVNMSLWSTTQEPDQHGFCQNPITSSVIFYRLGVDPDLFEQWIIQLILVAVMLRILAVVFLWVSNVEGFSWIRKHLVHCLCFLCSQKEV